MLGGRTWVEVKASALRANVRQFQQVLPPGVSTVLVVKANAYGHGTEAVVRSLARTPVWGFGLASGEEALNLRDLTARPLLVLSSWQTTELPDLIRQRVRLVVWDAWSARAVSRAAVRLGRPALVHLKVDTGASRIGVPLAEAPATLKLIERLPGLNLDGVFSHLADAESRPRAFTVQQIEDFERLRRLAPAAPWHHVACTAAVLRYPRSHGTLVRIGVGLYGLWPSPETARATRRRHPTFALRPVLTWQTRLLQVKDVPTGRPVGYALTFRTRRRTRLGVLPVGYWDGYDRRLSNRGRVLVRGQRAPVIGRVSMNLTLVDCTDIPAVRPGDLVTLIGQQGSATVTAEELAAWTGTINYEIVSRINPDLPRRVT